MDHSGVFGSHLHNSTPDSISKRNQTVIHGHIKSKTEINSTEVKDLVEVIDQGEPTLCKRLDARTLCLVGSILRLSVPCRAQERGFFLLAV